mmetsp:Transcript_5321/g.12712  ORF Transcript_5321/g.12712 Transcript_5321/m.12712 type:complete len:225 (-) Transcript_5321:1680-2354(-)
MEVEADDPPSPSRPTPPTSSPLPPPKPLPLSISGGEEFLRFPLPPAAARATAASSLACCACNASRERFRALPRTPRSTCPPVAASAARRRARAASPPPDTRRERRPLSLPLPLLLLSFSLPSSVLSFAGLSAGVGFRLYATCSVSPSRLDCSDLNPASEASLRCAPSSAPLSTVPSVARAECALASSDSQCVKPAATLTSHDFSSSASASAEERINRNALTKPC